MRPGVAENYLLDRAALKRSFPSYSGNHSRLCLIGTKFRVDIRNCSVERNELWIVELGNIDPKPMMKSDQIIGQHNVLQAPVRRLLRLDGRRSFGA